MKKLLLFLLVFFISFLPLVSANEPVDLYLFYSETCPHCHREREFLSEFEKQNPDLFDLHEYELKENGELFEKVSYALNEPRGYVPYLVIENQVIVGFGSDETTGEMIKTKVQECASAGCYDVVECDVLNPGSCETQEAQNEAANEEVDQEASQVQVEEDDKVLIEIPFTGKSVDVSDFSLPVLSVFLGFVDGFNPCAMWVLLFLITLLLDVEDKKKRWMLGAIFIVSSAVVYFAALAGWGFVFSLLDSFRLIQYLVAVLAIVSGVNFLYKFYKNDVSCKVVDQDQKQNIFTKIDKIVKGENFWKTALLLASVAVTINLVELSCSIGLPMIFANVLEQSGLSALGRYFYMFIYIIFYMIDDLIIFTVSMITLQLSGVSSKYMRYVNLVGGLLLIFIAFALAFKPELLTLGV